MHKKTLTGKRILITRAREQSSEFAAGLRGRGAEVVEFPTIEIVPPLRWEDLDRAIEGLDAYDWIIFTSVNGVTFFWQRLNATGKGPGFPTSVKVCAIGPATARQLKKNGIRVDYTPKEYVAEAILEGFEKMNVRGKRILLARVKKARDILPKGLRAMGATIDVVEAYRTLKPRGGSKKLKKILTEEKIDVITFTSSSTVNHFIELLGKGHSREKLKGITIASIGPVTTRTAREQGLDVHIQPEAYTIPALTEAIVDYFAGKLNTQIRHEG
jgi:uroporphyrinogen III methyltransferase/synthase